MTPVRVEKLEELLSASHYDPDESRFLVEGFRHGFKLGYEGPTNRRTLAKNHRLRAGNQVVLWNKLMKEVKVGRLSGPYPNPPHKNFIQSPITLIPKKGSESTDPEENSRLIVDLSWPHGDSLNDHTPQSVKSVNYPLFDKAIQMCLKEGKGCYLARTDCKSAFLMLPLAPDQFCWVTLMCEHPTTKVKFYFCMKTVCFGSGTSCFLYMKFSNALAHIFRHRTISGEINNYLDDFLTCKIDEEGCNGYLLCFIDICGEINLPLSEDKTCFATQLIGFLGLLIDSVRQTVSIPLEKIERGKRELDIIRRSKKVTVHQLQKLTGLLNFLCKAIVPGRAFTRRFYARMSGLQKFHHIRVNREMKKDCVMWEEFLEMGEAVCRPFLDFETVLHADQIQYYTDGALDQFRLGVGGCYQGKYFTGILLSRHYSDIWHKLNIQIVELYAILLSLSLWIDRLRNRRVVIFCDNESVVHMLNKSTSGCKVCMIMIRKITLWSMECNARIFGTHLKSEENTAADLLSRGRVSEFLCRYQGDDLEQEPEPLPGDIWPIPLSWFD